MNNKIFYFSRFFALCAISTLFQNSSALFGQKPEPATFPDAMVKVSEAIAEASKKGFEIRTDGIEKAAESLKNITVKGELPPIGFDATKPFEIKFPESIPTVPLDLKLPETLPSVPHTLTLGEITVNHTQGMKELFKLGALCAGSFMFACLGGKLLHDMHKDSDKRKSWFSWGITGGSFALSLALAWAAYRI